MASTGDSKKSSGTRTSQKSSQKKKSESKKRQSTTGASPQNPKPAKQRKVEDHAKTNPPLAPKKIKDNIVNNKSENKKQSRKKTKSAPTHSITENSKETPDKKIDSSLLLALDEESENTTTVTSTSKSGSELSRSKKRRIRKRRLLESLGIVPPPATTVVTEKASKKKKKRKKKKATSSTVDNNLSEQTTNVKPSKKLNINISSSAKKTVIIPEEKKKDVALGKDEGSSGKVKEVPQETFSKTKPLIFENRAFKESQIKSKQKEIKSEDNTVAKICSNCDELQLIRQEFDNEDTSAVSESQSPIEEVSHFLDKKEETSPPLKTDLVNFLSHNNVEGLFRSALLNDVTLSSRCSEKEVKNFFNTYGTFSERGRTQFAAVEKLLSNNKSNEEISSSQFFESSADKGAQNVTPTVPENKDILDSKPSSSLLETNKFEYFSVKHLKDTLNSEEPQSSISAENFESEVSSNIVKESCRRDSLGSCLVLTGGFSHGPIYTSPNFQNRVTSSANSNQIQGSGSRVFLPNVYGFSESKITESSFCSYKTSCREQDKPESKSAYEVKHNYNHDNNFTEDSAAELNSGFPEDHLQDSAEDDTENKEGIEDIINVTCSETVKCNEYAEVSEPLEQVSSNINASGLKNEVDDSNNTPPDSLSAPLTKVPIEKVTKATGKGKESCEKGSKSTEKVVKGKGESAKTVKESTTEIAEKDIVEVGEKAGKSAKKNKEFVPKSTEAINQVTVKLVKESEKNTDKNSLEETDKISETSKSAEKDQNVLENLGKVSEKDLEVSEKDVDGAEKDAKTVEKHLKSEKELKHIEGSSNDLKAPVNVEIPAKNSQKETDVEDCTEVADEVKSEQSVEGSIETNEEIVKTAVHDEELQSVERSEDGAVKVVENPLTASEKDSAEADKAQENIIKDIECVTITEKYIQSFKKVLEDTEKELEALDIQSRKQITRSTREEVERLQKAVQGINRDRKHIENGADTVTVEKEVQNIETNKESIDKILESIEKDINSAEKKVIDQEIVVDSCEKDNLPTSETACVPETKEPPAMDTAQGKAGKKQEKSREEIGREREARKAAKTMKKGGKVADAAKTPVTKPVNDQEVALKLDSPLKSKPKEVEAQAVKTKVDKAPSKTKEKEVVKDKVVEKENEIPISTGKPENATDAVTSQAIPQVQKEVIGDTPGKSKAELKAERRAKQEAQRAAKAAQQSNKQQVKPPAEPQKPAAKDTTKDVAEDMKLRKISKALVPTVKPKVLEHKVKLFNHLYPQRTPSLITEDLMLNSPDLHPALVRLGVQYASRIVVGSNARCIALLNALKQLIQDYKTPPQKEFSRGLEASLQSCVTFLEKCRPLSVSMTNALRHLKWHLTQLPNNVSDSEAKKKLQDAIDTYIRDQIEVAAQAICIMVQHKIADGDVILVYSCSSLVQRILIEAHNSGTKFRVVVVDGRPWREGREMLRRLVSCGLKCTYVLVSAASFIMREVTKVLLGAHALLANGYVMSRAGASQIALVAHAYNVPVLVCCETHKFCERVQTDSFVYNELGDPDDLVSIDSCSGELPLSKWRSIGSLTPLNLTYDVTPPDLVTAVVTELAILPCTSVPVILRIKPTETGC